MAKFRAVATYTSYCEVIIEAESEDEAFEIAQSMDGGDFTPIDGGDWDIDSVTEITE
jgi:hypothetical protein